ncbi:MAG: ribonuclease P protein component [bacterium]|nr:ribonuclease P protein component [bacterium]
MVSARDYARVRRRGRRLASRNFAVSIASRGEVAQAAARRGGAHHPSRTRLGMAVSRKVGNAVVRNRVKRAIREWFRTSRDELAQNVDIVVIARPGAAKRETTQIARELNSLLATQREEARKAGARQ